MMRGMTRMVLVTTIATLLVGTATVAVAQVPVRKPPFQHHAATVVLEPQDGVDGTDVLLRFQGSNVPALGIWLDFQTDSDLDLRRPTARRGEVVVESLVRDTFQFVDRVRWYDGGVQVRLALMEGSLPFEGLRENEEIAVIHLPRGVRAESVQVIEERTSASDMRAHDIPLQVLVADTLPRRGGVITESKAQALAAKSVRKGTATSTAPGIDFEIYDPVDYDNGFCVEASGQFTANVLLRAGNDTSTTCTQSCGQVDGGDGRLATAVLDIAFDTSKLSVSSAGNVDYADGLIQDNYAEGRVGWAAAGDWDPDATTTGTLATPCVMTKMTSEMDVMAVTFDVDENFDSGSTTLHFRTSTDGFAFSAADACATGWDEEDFDEIIDAVVGIDISIDSANSGLTSTASPIDMGTGTSDLTATVKDSGGSGFAGEVVNMDLVGPNYSGATLGTITDNDDGTYAATLSAGPNPGRVKVTYSVDTCSGTWTDDPAEDEVIIINNPAWGCDAGDANGTGGLTTADGLAVLLEVLDGDSNTDPTGWEGAGSYAGKPCADANGNGSLSAADGTAILLMVAEGM